MYFLDDKRVVAFVSHAGGGSVMEVARAAVPTIFVPLFGQFMKRTIINYMIYFQRNSLEMQQQSLEQEWLSYMINMNCGMDKN